MAWQLPQITVVTVAEILFSITSLEFSFTQVKCIYFWSFYIIILYIYISDILLKAPTGMKSLLEAVNILTVAFGNLIVAIVSEMRIYENQVYLYNTVYCTTCVLTFKLNIFSFLGLWVFVFRWTNGIEYDNIYHNEF